MRTERAESNPVQQALAGLTVAFSLLSKAIACAAIVGVSPLVGLWSSVVMGVTAPLLGSRPGIISGAAAVVVVPLGMLVKAHGASYIPLTICLAAAFELAFAALRLAKWSVLVSDAVMAGFLSALGLILFESQLKIFTHAPALAPAVGVATFCFGTVLGLPRLTTAVPSSLAGLVLATAAGAALGLPLATLADSAGGATFAGGLASLPSAIDLGGLLKMSTSLPALRIVLPTAISVAFISILETLLAGRVADEMTDQPLCTFVEAEGKIECLAPPDEGLPLVGTLDVPTKSVLAMAVGNLVSALLGGFGGCGLIPQTVLNVKSGGGGALSSAAYALSMGAFVVFLAPLVGQIPLAALAGIMFTVAFDTVPWGATASAVKAAVARVARPGADSTRVGARTELAALLTTFWLCYKNNMATGIVAGVAVQRGLRYLAKLGGGGGTSTQDPKAA